MQDQTTKTGTWVNPEQGATEEDFHREVISNIPAELIGDDGKVFSPQDVALNAFRDNRARQSEGETKPNLPPDGTLGSITIEGRPMPGYQEIVAPGDMYVSEQPISDQAGPERSPELVG